MGFYREICTTYGHDAMVTLKQWANNNTSLASFRNRKHFLTRCKAARVFPRHVTQNINIQNIELPAQGGQVDIINDRLRLRIIKLEISFCFQQVNRLEKACRHFENVASELLPQNLVANYRSRLKYKYNRLFNNFKKKTDRKLGNLIGRVKEDLTTQESWLRNLSEKPLPDDVKKILSLGPKFAFPPDGRDLSVKHLLADVENAILRAPKTQNILRAKVTNVITNHLKKQQGNKDITTSMLRSTRTFLKENTDLVVTKSDKGNVTVILNKTQYDDKVVELLQDRSVYTVLNRDPTQTIQTKNNAIVKLLREENHLNESEAKRLTTYKAVAPRFYGLPKIHKENVPIRPIVSTTNSPTSAISKWIANILKESFRDYNEFAVDNSFIFAEKINDFQLPDEHKVVSLDVVSLFTNISLELTLHIIQEEWTLIEQHTSVPIEHFIEIIEFIFNNNYFVYNDTYYTMVFGCPMGSCLSPILANIVMSTLIKTSLNKLSFSPPFLYQYVDDIITSVPVNKLPEVLETFNNFDEHLEFTAEEEDENSVPFLDTRVIRRQDNRLMLDWYQKKTSSGRYVHFRSYHEVSMKTNVILAMKDRIKRIAHPTLYEAAITRLKNIFKTNGYPMRFLNRLLYNTRDSDRNTTRNYIDEDAPQPEVHTADVDNHEGEISTYISLPNVEQLTGKLINILQQENTKFAKYNIVTNRTLFTNLKDKLPKTLKSDVVYEIPCSGCEKRYIGQCSTTIKQRIALHKSDITLRPDRCSLAQHARDSGHNMNFDDIKILTQERKYYKRTFLEMCYINEKSETMNAKSDVENLSIIYGSLLLHDLK